MPKWWPGGDVVAVGTRNSHIFRNDYPTYPLSGGLRAALEVMVRALAADLAPHGATVNCVVPARRIGEPDEVAAIAFLASPDASYVAGRTIHVNGGFA